MSIKKESTLEYYWISLISVYSFFFFFTIFIFSIERLLNGIENLKKALAYKYSNLSENTEDVNTQIESYVTSATSKFSNNCSHFSLVTHIKYHFTIQIDLSFWFNRLEARARAPSSISLILFQFDWEPMLRICFNFCFDQHKWISIGLE